MGQLTTCQTKKFYDTRFEAEIAASKTEAFLDEEFMVYPCGTHWHISHKDPEKRLGAGNKYWKCSKCRLVMKKQRIGKHKCRK